MHDPSSPHRPPARLATAADLAAAEALLADPRQVDVVARALADPRARVVVSASGDGLAVLDLRPDTEGLATAAVLRGDPDVLLPAAAGHAADVGCAGVRDARGAAAHPAPPPGPSLAERFRRAAATAAARAEVAAARTAGLGEAARKADGSVTVAADRAADEASAAVLAALGVPMLSEERADVALPDPDAPWLVVDPIDGTGNYRAGMPPWAFAAGLVAGGQPLAGYVADLSSGRRWWGEVGAGAHRDGHPARPRPGTTLVIPTPPAGDSAPVPPPFRRLRITGCTAVDLCLVADGSAAAWHDLDRAGTHVHDVAGALGVLAAAGGAVLDPTGAPLRLEPDTVGLIRFAAAADEATAAALVQLHR